MTETLPSVLTIAERRMGDATYSFAIDPETEALLETAYPKSKCGLDTAEMSYRLLVYIKHGVYHLPVKQRLLASTLINGLPHYHTQKILAPLHVRGTNLVLRLVIAATNRVDRDSPLLIRGECCTLEGRSYCKPPDKFVKAEGVRKALKSALAKDRGHNKLTARIKQALPQVLRIPSL